MSYTVKILESLLNDSYPNHAYGTRAKALIEALPFARKLDERSEASKPPAWRDGRELPELGDHVLIELASGDLVRGRVNQLDVNADEGLDVMIYGALAAPKNIAHSPRSWWSGTNLADYANARRVRWMKVEPCDTDDIDDE